MSSIQREAIFTLSCQRLVGRSGLCNSKALQCCSETWYVYDIKTMFGLSSNSFSLNHVNKQKHKWRFDYCTSLHIKKGQIPFKQKAREISTFTHLTSKPLPVTANGSFIR